MSPLAPRSPEPRFRRRDPRWEEDGPIARREHRSRRVRELAAFSTSVVAVGLSVAVWAIHFGVHSPLHG
jgi:hypothetical protein